MKFWVIVVQLTSGFTTLKAYFVVVLPLNYF
jgi:hypothetical protein